MWNESIREKSIPLVCIDAPVLTSQESNVILFFLKRRENLWKSVAGFQYFVFLVFSVSWWIDISRSRRMTMTHPMPNPISTTTKKKSHSKFQTCKQLLMRIILLKFLVLGRAWKDLQIAWRLPLNKRRNWKLFY